MTLHWSHLWSTRHLVVAAFISVLIAFVVHFAFPRQSPQPLLEIIGLTPVTNEPSIREIPLNHAGCEDALAADVPMLVLADLNVRATSTFEGYFEISRNEEGLFVDYDPVESGLLRLGVATSDGLVARERLRTMRGPSSEPIAVFLVNNTVTWWSKERSAQIASVTPFGCSSLHVGTANGLATVPRGTSLAVLFGNDATNALPSVEKYFQNFADQPQSRRLISFSQLVLSMCLVLIIVQRTRQLREPRL